MSDNSKPKDFDPYREWLGIPPGPRPPSPEVLLRLSPGETNKERILDASLKQKKRLDDVMLREYNPLADRLTKEVAGAAALLLERAEAVVGQPVSMPTTDGKTGTPTTPAGKLPSLSGDTWPDGPSTVVGKVVRPSQPESRPSQTEGHGPSTLADAPVRGAPVPQDAPAGPAPATPMANLERVVAALGDLAAPDQPVVVSPVRRLSDKSVIPTLEEEEEEGNWFAGLVAWLRRTDRAIIEKAGDQYDILYKVLRTVAVALVGIAVAYGVWSAANWAVREIVADVKGLWQPAATQASPPQPPVVKPDTGPSLAVASFDASEAKNHQEGWAEHLGIPVVSTNSMPAARTGQSAAVVPEPLRLRPIPPQTVEVGTTLMVTVVAEGANLPDSSLRVTGWSTMGLNSSDGFVLDGATNIFRWTPTEKQGPGTYEITLSVEGPDGRKAKAPFTVTVTKPPAPVQPPAPSARPATTINLGGGVTLELVLIPAGSFMMGSPGSDNLATSGEKPSHLVLITRPFYLGKYEVTQEQWQAVMGDNPSRYRGPTNPVENVSWSQCQVFLGNLNQRHGTANGTFVLPTEAQWEYACRAGSTTRWCFGDDAWDLRDYAWYRDNSAGQTHPVGQKKPNAWGLYDMHGSVLEWCADWFEGPYSGTSTPDDPTGPAFGTRRVVRGGWVAARAEWTRSAHRMGFPPSLSLSSAGLRVARTIPAGALPSLQQPGGLGPPPPGAAPYPGMPPPGAAPYPGMPAPGAAPYPGMPAPGAAPLPGMPAPGAAPYPGMPAPGAAPLPGMPAGLPGIPGGSMLPVVTVEKDRVYQFGDWRICWPAAGTDVYLWCREGATAVEIVGAGNGFWRWRDASGEHTVWSIGSFSSGSFGRRPWMQSARGTVTAIGGFREFEVRGPFGLTRFSCHGKEITIVFTDKGTLSLSAGSPVVQFRTFNGRNVQFPSR